MSLPNESADNNVGTKTNASESASSAGKCSVAGSDDVTPPPKPNSPTVAKGNNRHNNNSVSSSPPSAPDWVRRHGEAKKSSS
eukprot:3915549-Ditylum_brightwellii.AAC.2